MNKKVSQIFQTLLGISVAVLLVRYCIHTANESGDFWSTLQIILQRCHWGFVFLSMLLGVFVLYLRSLRWQMQLLPIDPSTSRLTCWNSYNICMIVNLALPRVGEVVRCGYITKHSGRTKDGEKLASLDKVFGTVVVDRAWDALSLALLLFVVLIVLWDRFGAFFSQTVFRNMVDKAHLWWVPVLGILLAGGFLFLCWKLRERGRIWSKIWKVIRGMVDGLSSCLHMNRGWMFIIYTVAIWGCYWLMSASILWSLHGIDLSGLSPELADALAKVNDLGMADALFLMFAGALSSLIPVSGGFGTFHWIVAEVIANVYGIPFDIGFCFAILSHESQVIVNALCGAGSYVHETFFRR